VDLFVMPPNEQELLARLSGRGTDSPEVIELRMTNALEEMKHWSEYTHVMLSGTREDDSRRFVSLVTAERMKTSRFL
jgi:guanylate kinase